MAEDADTIVDVHYNGVFAPTPLMYFNGVKASVPYTVVNKMNFPDFIPFLEKLTNGRCKDVYYCPHEVRLSEGLHVIQNDCDFNEFLEDINEKKRLDMYVDHYHEPLFGWIQEEEADLEDEDLVSIDDVDSIFRRWAGIPLRCTICHQTGHNKATCSSKPTPAPSTAGPSQSTPASSTAGPSQSIPAPVKRTPVKKAPVKKANVKRSPMKKVPLNDAGRVRKFSEKITEISLQKNVKLKDGTGCSLDKPVTLK
ncbi:unnamed protein product [Lactuca virosa]|uniref:Uncharacterized protein n=1 Tax=Lactuca virosa TaxID=75947 RepID=A0AAU9LDG2_9ASTR|nr:unnamed protein product [Lactuca virosa]